MNQRRKKPKFDLESIKNIKNNNPRNTRTLTLAKNRRWWGLPELSAGAHTGHHRARKIPAAAAHTPTVPPLAVASRTRARAASPLDNFCSAQTKTRTLVRIDGPRGGVNWAFFKILKQ